MTNHPCCKLPLVKKYLVKAETRSGKKVQLTLDEATYQLIKPYFDSDPKAKLIVEDF